MRLGIKGFTIVSYILLLLIFIAAAVLHDRAVISLLSVIIITLISTSIMAYVAVVRLVGPLDRITSAAYDMAGGILDNEIMMDTKNEFDELATSINVIAEQLRQNLNKMNEERTRVQAILDSMGDGVLALDVDGRVLMLNPTVEKNFGLNKNNCIGKKVIEIIHNYELAHLLRQVLIDKKPLSSEMKLLLNSPRIFKVYATPLKRRGDSQVGVVALISDITERRQLDKMRTEFVANVSHELKTPLTSIKGFIETLLDGAWEDGQTAKHFLGIIKAETDRLIKLIDELLKLSKLEHKKIVLDKQQVNIASLINQVLFIFKPTAEEKGITLTSVVPEDLPPVLGEKDLLIQVLVNLVDNTMKYVPTGEKVQIKVRVKENHLQVTVWDTGVGIPPESLPRLFERFYRVDKARSRAAGGTGLGLAIAKHVVEVHGGDIWVDSSSQGTVFNFTLPLQ